MTPTMLNKSQVRKFALDIARQTRRPFTRVSSRFIEGIESAVRTTIAARVHAAKGGKTL
jgi:hypothetical protein